VAFSVAALAFGVTACGGGGDASTTVIGKAAFVKKANAICEATGEKAISQGLVVLHKIERDSGKSGREAEAIFVPQWFVPTAEAEIDELRSLGAPAGDADRVDAFLTALQEVIDFAKSNPRGYLYAQANFKHPYRKAEKLARDYGIASCGQP
jgi:hypothetical protein